MRRCGNRQTDSKGDFVKNRRDRTRRPLAAAVIGPMNVSNRTGLGHVPHRIHGLAPSARSLGFVKPTKPFNGPTIYRCVDLRTDHESSILVAIGNQRPKVTKIDMTPAELKTTR